MSVAVVFDSAGTLLNTYRVAKDIRNHKLLPGIETTTLTFSSPDRVLIVLPVHSKDLLAAPPETLLSDYLIRHDIGFGISCTRKITTSDEIGDILYADDGARVGDLQECIRNVWTVCKEESVVTLNSGAIINMAKRGIEFAITAGGWPFDGAKEAITALHRMGVPDVHRLRRPGHETGADGRPPWHPPRPGLRRGHAHGKSADHKRSPAGVRPGAHGRGRDQ